MKIKTTDQVKIETAIKKAEGKSRARTINYYYIDKLIEYAEKYLSKFPKKYHKGVVVTNVQKVSNSYRNRADYTKVCLTKGSGNSWFLTHVWRDSCGHCAFGSDNILIEKTKALYDYEISLVEKVQVIA